MLEHDFSFVWKMFVSSGDIFTPIGTVIADPDQILFESIFLIHCLRNGLKYTIPETGIVFAPPCKRDSILKEASIDSTINNCGNVAYDHFNAGCLTVIIDKNVSPDRVYVCYSHFSLRKYGIVKVK